MNYNTTPNKNIYTSYIKIPIVFLMIFLYVTNTTAQNVITKDISQGNVSISGSEDYIITGNANNTNFVIVEQGYQGTITLKDLTITHASKSCITINGENNRSNKNPITKVNIILEGTNTITYTGSTYCPIQVNQGAQVHFSSIDPNDNSKGILIAKNTGTANSSVGGGAGIGAQNNTNEGTSTIVCTSGSPSEPKTAGGNIIISSGTITAIGGHAAGIGGGWNSYYNGYIIIYGGEINTSAKYHAAGIGSGCPSGRGVTQCYAENSTILALPPAQIETYGTNTGAPDASLGLTGANNITYMNDKNKPEITVHTVDYEPYIDIYLDLTETPNLLDIFTTLGIDYDLTKVKVGTTDADGLLKFRAQFEQNTTFFTDASSSQEASLGRPYMPVETTVVGGVNDKVEIILPLLGTEISFIDYPSTPLEVGYTGMQAKNNAPRIKMEYKDSSPMTNVSFALQTGIDFEANPIFLNADNVEVPVPSQLNTGDIYYIVLPVVTGKQMGYYSDVLLINGNWKSVPLPGYIRKIGEQKVILNDTDSNEYIKVTASPNEFVRLSSDSGNQVNLSLQISHQGSVTAYNPGNVVAKYLITTEQDYETALDSVPLTDWPVLSVPNIDGQSQVTSVSFNDKPNGTYYIHWYVDSDVVYAHSKAITNPPAQYGGFGPYIIIDRITSGQLTGNPNVCNGQIPQEIKSEESTGGSEEYTYQWQKSIDGTNWSDLAANTQNYVPEALTVSPTFFRRLTIDNKYVSLSDTSNIFRIDIVSDNLTLYWNTNAQDRNWNNPDNWIDASGSPQNMVPVACYNVVIPGGATIYPSLNPAQTPVTVYGQPVCRNITFEYGSQLAYQHLLNYEKAYVQYLFGTPDSNETDKINKDRWYTLAMPLKKMASGDFSFGGYPFSWQGLSDGISGEDNFYSINFNKSYINNAVELSEANNCIALKIAPYQENRIGYSWLNIQKLEYKLEIPYFENREYADKYPMHSYDPITKQSSFYYYDANTLKVIYSSVGKMNRGDEAYRFVFENTDNTVENAIIEGESVPCYSMKINPNNTHKHVLIGNPFLAAINMKNFFEVNADVLDNSGYYVYTNTNIDNETNADGWKYYSYTDNNQVNSYEAFVVVFKSDAANQTLLFPLEGRYALTGTFVTSGLKEITTGLNVFISDSGSFRGDIAKLTPRFSSAYPTENIRKLISDEQADIPEVFFINNQDSNYNLIQSIDKGEAEVNLGIRYSGNKTKLTLNFGQVDEFSRLIGVEPVLLDKHLDKEQNLKENNIYEFENIITNESKINTSRFTIKFQQSNQEIITESNKLVIRYVQGILKIDSQEIIDTVTIYDLSGRLIFQVNKLGKSVYEKRIDLGSGIYVVKAVTEKGNSKSENILVPN